MRAGTVLAVLGSAIALATGWLVAAAEAGSSTAPVPFPAAEADHSTRTAEGMRVVEGPVVRTKYGPVQVMAALDGKRLVRVWALKVPNRYGRSVSASSAAIPVLERRSLDANSAKVDAVSGATYTSEGYRRSLQAALDGTG